MSKVRVFAVVFSLLLPVAVMAEIIHVPGDSATIQEGIDAAADGDTVLVADGTYTGDGNWDLDFNGKAIIVKSENGPENCIIDLMAQSHRGFCFQHGEGHDSVVDGFSIRNAEIYTHGGGFWCIDSSPTITGNWITGMFGPSGCGVYCSNGSPAITNNTIASNGTFAPGGGIYCVDSTSPLIKDNIISGNYTDHSYGAGICCSNSSPIITGNTISGNINFAGVGHGIYCSGCSGEISNNMITGNGSNSMEHSSGGGIFCSGSTMMIINNTITGNKATDSGGIYCVGSPSPTIRNNIISNNFSECYGGGIGCWNSSPEITNNLLAENRSVAGGGLYCQFNSSPTITSTTIVGNIAYSLDLGSGIYCDDSTAYVTNCILWSTDLTVTGGDPLTVSYSDVRGGYPGVGNFDANPLFVDGPDGAWCLAQMAAGQFLDSPCLDAGDDLAQNICYPVPAGQTCMNWLSTRTDGLTDTSTVDMGYHASPAMLAASLTCTPSSGTVPFETDFSIVVVNRSLDGPRTGVGWIDVELGNGSTIDLWREGLLELAPGTFSRTRWMQPVPASGAFLGLNSFRLRVVDVTPAPYNQPPCPPSGATEEHTALLTVFAP